jgi:hypothetical protein
VQNDRRTWRLTCRIGAGGKPMSRRTDRIAAPGMQAW